MAHAVLRHVYVFRGLPSPEHDPDAYGRSQAQRAQWEREKGVDVLCALATVREAQDLANDLVILASSDSDLAPAIDEVQRLGCAKVETFCWYDSVTRICYQLRPIAPGRCGTRGSTSRPSEGRGI